jgi:hypothetical protein
MKVAELPEPFPSIRVTSKPFFSKKPLSRATKKGTCFPSMIQSSKNLIFSAAFAVDPVPMTKAPVVKSASASERIFGFMVFLLLVCRARFDRCHGVQSSVG